MNPKNVPPPPASPTTDPAPRRVLIVDDNLFFCSCLRTIIEHAADLRVCDTAAATHDLPRRLATLQPHVLVLDLSVGPVGGIEAARSLRRAGFDLPILFVSSAPAMPRRLLARIADAAFATKGGNPDLLIACLRHLAAAYVGRLALAETAEIVERPDLAETAEVIDTWDLAGAIA